MDGQEVDRAAICIARAGLVALQGEAGGKGVDGGTLLAAVKVAEQGERLAGPLDRRLGPAFERRESRLADAQHAHIDLLGM